MSRVEAGASKRTRREAHASEKVKAGSGALWAKLPLLGSWVKAGVALTAW